MTQEKVTEILTVNISPDIASEFEDRLRKAFGESARWSSYVRPNVQDHPRMHPVRGWLSRDREFDVIVYDVGGYLSRFSEKDVGNLPEIVPSWFKEDLLAVVEKAFLLILVPSSVQQSVTWRFRPVVQARRHLFREREPAGWQANGVDPAEDLRQEVNNVGIQPKRDLLSSLRM